MIRVNIIGPRVAREKPQPRLHPIVQDFAKEIFFKKMLNDINDNVDEARLDALIDHSIMIAQRLAHKLYHSEND